MKQYQTGRAFRFPEHFRDLACRLVRASIWIVAYGISIAIFFRIPISSGLDLGFGERGDALIEISILEHWRNALSGTSSWNTTLYFYPYTGTLGYNDGYFLYGMSYSIWRLIFDPFHADTLNVLTFKTIGFVGAGALVVCTLGWGRNTGVFVALLWTISSNIHLQAVHVQLQSVALQPIAMILGVGCIRAMRDGRHLAARWRIVALAALMAAWLMTSYYMAWFTLFSGCLFALCWALLSGNASPRTIWRLTRPHSVTLSWGAGAFGVLILPFLTIYLPKLKETGGENYFEMLGYLVTPGIDMVNVGPQNYVWGWLFRPLFALIGTILPNDAALPHRVLGGEHEAGIPLFLCVAVVLGAWTIIVRRRMGGHRVAPIAWRAFALATMVAWLLTLQFWILSPWNLVFWLVPGAKGMRVVSRYQLWLTLPFILIAVGAHRNKAARLVRARPWSFTAIVLLLLGENLSAETPAQLSRATQRNALLTIPRPPADCAVFYVTASRVGEPVYINAELNALYPHNVDAMVLAELWKKPTINGFSTFNPPDWNFADPTAADYARRVRAYLDKHGIRHACRLDMRRAKPWSLI